MFKLPAIHPSLVRFKAITLILVAVFGAMYVTTQQSLRLTANDPQIQFAEDISGAMKGGVTAEQIVPPGTQPVDIATALTPFVIIYDAQGKALAGNGMLNGSLPTPPMEVLEAAKASGQNRITWQPGPGVRLATVIISTGGDTPNFVLAARSLREVDLRIQNTLYMSVIGFGVSLIILGLWTAWTWKPRA